MTNEHSSTLPSPGSRAGGYLRDLRALQSEVAPWSQRNFPGTSLGIASLGYFEEAGELARCIVKMEQGIRGTREQWLAEAAKEIGDNFIKLVDIADRLGLDAHKCAWDRWADGPKPIRERDWTTDRVGHGMPTEGAA